MPEHCVNNETTMPLVILAILSAFAAGAAISGVICWWRGRGYGIALGERLAMGREKVVVVNLAETPAGVN